MIVPIYQVDAFTDRVFDGNPAAVCLLESWLSDRHMQFIAAENNLPETAFFVAEEDEFRLRWFTPQVEVDLCGHATLATASILFRELGYHGSEVRFRTMKAGTLRVTRQDDDWFALDFPSRPPAAVAAPAALAAALGAAPSRVLAARDYVAIYEDAAAIRALKPDMAALAALDRPVMATAPGEDCDFVSRFFAPGMGIPEDPVTGSAHCTLIPYWAGQLGRTELTARQLSARGGYLRCAHRGDRVSIAGQAVLYLKGELFL